MLLWYIYLYVNFLNTYLFIFSHHCVFKVYFAMYTCACSLTYLFFNQWRWRVITLLLVFPCGYENFIWKWEELQSSPPLQNNNTVQNPVIVQTGTERDGWDAEGKLWGITVFKRPWASPVRKTMARGGHALEISRTGLWIWTKTYLLELCFW
jgi:hypothetical protein